MDRFFSVAVIKYWGKDNVKLNTPMNSSASLTLDQVLSFLCADIVSN